MNAGEKVVGSFTNSIVTNFRVDEVLGAAPLTLVNVHSRISASPSGVIFHSGTLEFVIPKTAPYTFSLGESVTGSRIFSLDCPALAAVLSSVFNPTGGANLNFFSTATGFAGLSGIFNGLNINVRTRFFGGLFADRGLYQVAAAYQGRSLSFLPNNKVEVTPDGRLRWSAWFRGTTTFLNDGTPGASFDGSLYSATGGVDYLVTDNILVGLMFGYEDFKLDTKFNAGAFEGSGYSVGPYVAVRFWKRYVVNALFAYTWLKSDLNGTSAGTTAAGGYDSTRWLVTGNLEGTWRFGRLRLSPAVGVIYARERRPAFTNSAAFTTPATTTVFGRISFGPEIGFTLFRRGHTYVEPFVSIKGQYDFETRGSLVLSSGAIVPARQKLLARQGFGVNLRLGQQFTARLGGFYDGIGRRNYSAWTIELRARIRW